MRQVYFHSIDTIEISLYHRTRGDGRMKVAVLMGSDSDWPILKPAVELLKQFGIEPAVKVASAHRTPSNVRDFVVAADRSEDVAAFIVAAGAAAHLAGVVASYTIKPVIGIPVNATPLNGMDALLSTVQMPSGVPVATMAVNGAKNAAIFAAEILAVKDPTIAKALVDYRKKMVLEVEAKAERVAAQL